MKMSWRYRTKKTIVTKFFLPMSMVKLRRAPGLIFFLEVNGQLFTPPISSGVLNGTLRSRLLKDGYKGLTEKILTPEDVITADAIYFGNSVRDLMPAEKID